LFKISGIPYQQHDHQYPQIPNTLHTAVYVFGNPFDYHEECSQIVLPWVHKTMDNSKKLSLNLHHRIDNDFLQSYLNEFCFKFNRRNFDNVFDRMMVTVAPNKWDYIG